VRRGESPPWIDSDDLWQRIEPLLSEVPRRPRNPGRERLPDRQVRCGILFVLHTGIQWEFLPQELGVGSGMTCGRRLAEWNKAGVWTRLPELLLAELHPVDMLDWDRCVSGSSQVRAARRGPKAGRARSAAPDRAHDHDKYRRRLRAKGIATQIARRGQARGSGLGRVRWGVERAIARSHGMKRLRIRWERHDDIHEAFLGLATCIIFYRHVSRFC
jgi:transposase